MPKNRIGVIVLAAGASVRMGEPKQLIEISGVPLILHSVQAAIDCGCGPVIVVLGANAEMVRSEVEGLEISLAINSDWPRGMSTTIRCGLKKLLAVDPKIEGVLLMPADQPDITGSSLEKITAVCASTNSGMVAARFNDAVGTPAFFSRDYFDELLQLYGQGGAKSLLEKYHARVQLVDLPEAAQDLDTPDDVAAFKKTYFKKSSQARRINLQKEIFAYE